jgi:hypothetical protein
MEIKTSLKQLGKFFAQSAATEELTLPVRRFAAQLTILTAHIQRIEATAKRVTEDLEKRIEAFEAVLAAPQDPAAQAAAPSGAPSAQEQTSEEQPDEEAEAMAAKVQAETEAELTAITNGAAEPEVVVMPAGARKNGGKKPSQVGA